MKEPAQHAWSAVARNLHWLMAALLIGQWIAGKVGHEMASSPLKVDVMLMHKSTGIIILLLALFRLVWRLTHKPPPAPQGTPAWEHRAAAAGHALLYGLMIAIPVSGWLMNSAKGRVLELFWLVPWPSIAARNDELEELSEEIHEMLAILFAVILIIHVLAALRHHLLHRNDVLKRMLGR